MKTPKINEAPEAPIVNLAPGFAVLIITIILVIFFASYGLKIFPFGFTAIAACAISALRMIQLDSSTPGYIAPPLVMMIVIAGLIIPIA